MGMGANILGKCMIRTNWPTIRADVLAFENRSFQVYKGSVAHSLPASIHTTPLTNLLYSTRLATGVSFYHLRNIYSRKSPFQLD